MGQVANIWRHPIKSHGREALDRVTLGVGQTMPWDRHWAITHEKTKFDASDPVWIMCRNFMIGAQVPTLAGLWASLDADTQTITVRHDKLGAHAFRPDDAVAAAGFLNWVAPLTVAFGSKPAAVVSAGERGMTDTDYPTVSIMNTASHRAVAGRLGRMIEMERWRGNIWLEGPAPWEEWDWIGRDIRIGGATLRVREPIKRCMHTAANPVTGLRDIDTLGTLRDGWDHQNFGVYAEVISGGDIVLGDGYEVL